jgi:hypothetical protein
MMDAICPFNITTEGYLTQGLVRERPFGWTWGWMTSAAVSLMLT